MIGNRLERAKDMEAQAVALLKHANLSDRALIAEAAAYITCAAFLRKGIRREG